MNPCVAALLSVLLTGTGVGQKPEPSLKDAIAWIASFSKIHGVWRWEGRLSKNVITPAPCDATGCVIEVSDSHLNATKDNEVKSETEIVDLADLDPAMTKVRVEKNEQGHLWRTPRRLAARH